MHTPPACPPRPRTHARTHTAPYPHRFRTLVTFVEEEYGVRLFESRGQPLAKQRAEMASFEIIQAFEEQVAPDLQKFQEASGAVPMNQVGNWDETQLDLCAYSKGAYLVPYDGAPLNVITPFERSPHITLVLGFVGSRLLRVLMIIKGAPGCSPSPAHLQLLKKPELFCITQSESAWIDNEIK